MIAADEQKTLPAKLLAAYVVALSAVMLFGIASAAWWVWSFHGASRLCLLKGSGTSVCRRSDAVHFRDPLERSQTAWNRSIRCGRALLGTFSPIWERFRAGFRGARNRANPVPQRGLSH
jgi:hypothetical protein